MRLSKKISKHIVAFIFTWVQLAPHLAFANTEHEQVLIEMAKGLPPGAQVGVNTRTKNINGETVEIQQYYTCTAGGRCVYYPERTYRTTTALVQVDGHFYATQIVDRTGSEAARLALTTISGQSKTGNFSDLDPATISKLDITPSSPLYKGIADQLPQIAAGLQSGMESYLRSAEVGRALQEAYNRVLDQVARAGDGRQREAAGLETLAKMNSLSLGASLSAQLGSNAELAAQEDFQKYQRALNDPFAFKKYSLSEENLREKEAALKSALAQKQARKAVEISQALFNQADSAARNLQKQKWASAFNDGILKTSALGSPESSPWDKAKILSPAFSPGGQTIRQVANKAQMQWVSSKGLQSVTEGGAQAFLLGSATLRAADEAFAGGDHAGGYALAKTASSLFDVTYAFGSGAFRGIKDSLTAFPTLAIHLGRFGEALATDPESASQMAANFISNVPGLMQAMLLQKIDQFETLSSGTPEERAELLGQIAGELLIDWVTEGTLSVVRNSARGAKLIEKSSRLSQTARAMAAKNLGRGKSIVQNFSGARGKALLDMAKKSPQAAIETIHQTTVLIAKGRQNAAEFLGKVVAGKDKIGYIGKSGDAKKIADAYTKIEDGLKQISKSSYEGEISRGIEKSLVINGKVITNSKKDIFKVHDGMKYGNGRFSIGGSEGEVVLYTVAGSSNHALDTIARETNVRNANDLFIDTKSVSLKKGLDLTADKNLEKLGISKQDLVQSASHSDAYLYTQILGSAAVKEGFEFLIVPSAAWEATNIIILGPLLNRGLD